jgi:hypothetical protein
LPDDDLWGAQARARARLENAERKGYERPKALRKCEHGFPPSYCVLRSCPNFDGLSEAEAAE